MKDIFRKHTLVHGICILGFVIATILLYHPYFLDGKQISQHDILQASGANHQLIDFREQTGEEALWMNTMFSGMPAYLNGVQYSGDIIKYVYRFIKLGMPHPEGITLISFISFYILLIAFGVRPWIAFAGALAFGMNGFSIISITAGHNAKIAAVALMPLVLAGIHLAFNNKRWLGIGLTALGLALHLHTNHYQITYYLLIMTMVYGGFVLYHAIKENALKPFGLTMVGLIIAAILAVGANAGELMTVMEYSKYSIRGQSELQAEASASAGLDKEYAFRYSNGIFEPLFLFIPNFMGGSSQQALDENSETAKALRSAGMDRVQINRQLQAMPTYWGDQPLTAPYYAGSLVVLLFVISLFVLSAKEKSWLIVIVIIGIVLSWGSNFSTLNTFLFDYLPGYNKFRSVTFTIVMTIMAMNILGFMALEKLWSREWDKRTFFGLLKPIGLAGGVAFLLIIISGMLGYKGAVDAQLPEWLISAIRADRASLLRSDAFRALFFIAAFVGLLWAQWQNKLSKQLAIAGVILIVGIDVFSLSKRFLKSEGFEKSPSRAYFQPSEADQYIMKNSNSGDRVLNLQNPFNEARTSYYHESVGGYHGAKLRRYQDLISAYIGTELSGIVTNLRAGQRNFTDFPVINMLNTKYLMAGNTRNAVLPNPNALGNAWIVSDIVETMSADEELAALGSIDPAQEAVVDVSKFNLPETSPTATGSVKVLKRTPNEIIYEARVNGDALAVFSEVYYPKGWRAFVDGNEVDIVRANYILRALPLNSGNHEIKFEFKPKAYLTGNLIALISGSLVLVMFFGGIALTIKR